jgi:hypothetical protein
VATLLGDIGTLEWCRRTNGILGRGERARFLAAVVLDAARLSPRLLAARAGASGSGPDPSEVTPPDTAFTRDVIEACGDLDPMVVEHGIRSYIFAAALGRVEGIDCDQEALFAASVLHDYAFATMDKRTDKCFTLVGAEAAADLLAASPLSAALQREVQESITLHLNPVVSREQSELAHLVHDGVLVDVLGVRAWQLDGAGVARVNERHPRLGFTVRAEPLLRAHARLVRGCRAGALLQAGFGTALRTGPWHAVDKAGAGAAAQAVRSGRATRR